MVDTFGYAKFFVATSTIGIPVALLCLVVWRLSEPQMPAEPSGQPVR